MANPLLHIKDSYYFEVPKALWPSKRTDKSEFPDVWVRLDDQYQDWEASSLAGKLESISKTVLEQPSQEKLLEEYTHWKHADHANHGKHLYNYLEEPAESLYARFLNSPNVKQNPELKRSQPEFDKFLSQSKTETAWFASQWFDKNWREKWEKAKNEADNVSEFKAKTPEITWSKPKLDAYNYHLSGRILIPQPPNVKLRNFYQSESGFAISKFMILELVAAFIICFFFVRLASRVKNGETPRGPLWNMLEAVLLFLRDQVVRPAIGDHHHEEHAHGNEHASHDRTEHTAHGHEPHGHAGHGHVAPAHAAAVHVHAADKYVPLLWTIFCFVLLCNLLGMVPYLGAPTSSWGVTLAMALVTLGTVTFCGMREFGFLGFFKNQVPSMGLPVVLAIPLVPMIFLIEMLGLVIKHTVLSIRLLMNMVAGHLVILGIMGLAFTLEAAMSPTWVIAAPIAVLASASFNLLELLVAFLQAYIFTFLSALFIAAAVHKH